MICSECGKEVSCPNPHAVSGPTGIVWSCTKTRLARLISIPIETFNAYETKLAAARKLADAISDWGCFNGVVEDALRAFREVDK